MIELLCVFLRRSEVTLVDDAKVMNSAAFIAQASYINVQRHTALDKEQSLWKREGT